MGSSLCGGKMDYTKEGFSESGEVTLWGDLMQPGTRAIMMMFETCGIKHTFKECDLLLGQYPVKEGLSSE
jgi:hypothetical protein